MRSVLPARTSAPWRPVLGALVLAVLLSSCRFTGFFDAPSQEAAGAAVAWLRTQQQADGGFEVAGFPGFETPDAVLAIAEEAQPDWVWSATAARNAVLATVENGNTPLDALDDFADGALTAGQAAKLVVLVTQPLGLNPRAFDPEGDGARNLMAVIDAAQAPNGSYAAGALNATLYAAIAKRLVDGAVPATTLAYIRSVQQANGGWNFGGDPTGTDVDPDTTGLAIQALAAAGVAPTDPDLVQALALLALAQRPNGAWQSFGADDPNSTAVAVLAITAAGFDPTIPCWRNTIVPALAGQSYSDPVGWIRSQQLGDGRIASPSDAFGVNTFATSQGTQAQLRGWNPVLPLAPRGCV